MLRNSLQTSIVHVGMALREPEEFALRWHREGAPYGVWVWAALAFTAVLGTATYGLTMGILGGPFDMVSSAILLTIAAGLAWLIPLPGLYILNSLSGSRLRLSTTVLAALVTTSWGGLAMIASIPINWFFSVAIPALPFPISVAWWVWLVNIVVFTGVGVAMIDVFGRVMQKLEPVRGRAPTWCLALVGLIGTELMYAFGLFHFAARVSGV
ncbi:MAG: hypothetical protein HY000_08030 [Planctomycetes bacterium]|nr:hypothetical protein [Planctomycetota bacterium]